MQNAKSQDQDRDRMFHEALDNLLTQASKFEGQLGNVTLAYRYDARAGSHVHAGATLRHRLHTTVTSKPTFPETEE